MKNKKLFYGFIVLVALLCLGIGYAAVSKNLTINGKVNADAAGADALQVEFTAHDDTKCTTAIASDGQSATITTESLKAVGDKAIAVITITNKSQDLRAKITEDTAVAFTDAKYDKYFTLETTNPNGVILDAKTGTTTITVTITLKELPVTAISNAAFTVILKAEAVELGA